MIRRRIVERTGIRRLETGARPDDTGNQQVIYRQAAGITRRERREPASHARVIFPHAGFPFFVGRMNSAPGCLRPVAPPKTAAKRKAPARGGRRAQFQLWIFSYPKRVEPSKKRVSRFLFKPLPRESKSTSPWRPANQDRAQSPDGYFRAISRLIKPGKERYCGKVTIFPSDIET